MHSLQTLSIAAQSSSLQHNDFKNVWWKTEQFCVVMLMYVDGVQYAKVNCIIMGRDSQVVKL